jgi:hypothetical protein
MPDDRVIDLYLALLPDELMAGARGSAAATGEDVDDRGQAKHYVATDNVVDERWTGLPEGEVIDALAGAGIAFDRTTRTGVVPHMSSCLAVDGRFGFTAIGDTAGQASSLHEATRAGRGRAHRSVIRHVHPVAHVVEVLWGPSGPVGPLRGQRT